MTRRNRRVLTFLAGHVALLGLVFQIAAFDHWGQSTESVEEIHLHNAHCHGAAAGCADGGGASLSVNGVAAAEPLPPPASRAVAIASDLAPREAPTAELFHPPRAA
jgi:hypothetical protein